MIDKLEFGLHSTKDTTTYVKSWAVIVNKKALETIIYLT